MYMRISNVAARCHPSIAPEKIYSPAALTILLTVAGDISRVPKGRTIRRRKRNTEKLSGSRLAVFRRWLI